MHERQELWDTRWTGKRPFRDSHNRRTPSRRHRCLVSPVATDEYRLVRMCRILITVNNSSISVAVSLMPVGRCRVWKAVRASSLLRPERYERQCAVFTAFFLQGQSASNPKIRLRDGEMSSSAGASFVRIGAHACVFVRNFNRLLHRSLS